MERFSGIKPIGTFCCEIQEKYQAARQPGLMQDVNGVIRLNTASLYEQALEDLEGFQRIWVIFMFDRVNNWKPKVNPPRGGKKRGVFATRSPHRPNPIGLSCVELVKVDGLELHIGDHDLLDQTPVIDIKPYLPYADAFPKSSAGWVDELTCTRFDVKWPTELEEQLRFIKERSGLDLLRGVRPRLESNPFPHPSHRIRQLDVNHYEIAYKSWRIIYTLSEETFEVTVCGIRSGYLSFAGEDVYGDFSLHQEFCHRFTK